jgi:ribosome maturation factor RimP
MSATDREPLELVVTPIVESLGLDLESLKTSPAGRRHLVKVVVDSDDGVDLDRCADASRLISRALDETNAMGEQPYTLEVTSPGVSRPLTLSRHWRRAIGRLARVTFTSGDTVTGRVTDTDEAGATLDIDGGSRRIEFDAVRKAKVQVEFKSADSKDAADSNGESE